SDIRPQIAFAGRSNVGKSTLLNKLSGRRKLAKISKTPGKTRRIDFFLVDDRYYLVDLPGYGYVKAGLEARKKWGQLVENYLRHVDNLRGLILLLDCRREPNDDDLMMINWMEKGGVNYVIVLTKADKLSKSRLIKKTTDIEGTFKARAIPFSSLSGLGKTELTRWIENIVRNQALSHKK
ncbi:MAG: YihA family ribosome biogenesis GTP-binding protein, partial [Candidatus Zixiibacteriota bacterium]